MHHTLHHRIPRRRVPAAFALAPALVSAILLLVVLTISLALAGGARAAADKAPDGPRYGTLRADQVNLRAGPGERYPIQWVFTRKGLPVQILAEYDVWRKIRDFEGTEGWVHERMVTGNRSVVVDGAMRTLRAEPAATAPAVAQAEPGVIAHLLECRSAWCRVEAQGIKGWLQRIEVWGVSPTETVP